MSVVQRPTYSEVALEWERYADDLEKRLRREEESHAELQSRCFEGFPSVSDGIFDAYKEAVAAANRAPAYDAMLAALYECEAYLTDREDVVDGSYGEPAPNREMSLLIEVSAAIKAAEGVKP